MSGSSSRWPHLATRHDITVWAQRVDAPPVLPRLIRRLVDPTNDQVVELQMRADEGMGLQGYDGYSRALRGTPLVPEGPAVWEMEPDRPRRDHPAIARDWIDQPAVARQATLRAQRAPLQPSPGDDDEFHKLERHVRRLVDERRARAHGADRTVERGPGLAIG